VHDGQGVGVVVRFRQQGHDSLHMILKLDNVIEERTQ